MGQGEKRLEQMRNNPSGDWTIADTEVVCRKYDIVLEAPNRGSHWSIFHPRAEIQAIPALRAVKSVYIREFVKFVDKVTAGSDER